jgi:hypothetical protein
MVPYRFAPLDTDGEFSSSRALDHIISRSAASTPTEKSEQQQKKHDVRHNIGCAHMKRPRGTLQCPAQSRMVKPQKRATHRKTKTTYLQANLKPVHRFDHAKGIGLVDDIGPGQACWKCEK